MLAFQAPHKKIGPVIASSSGPVSLLLRAHKTYSWLSITGTSHGHSIAARTKQSSTLCHSTLLCRPRALKGVGVKALQVPQPGYSSYFSGNDLLV